MRDKNFKSSILKIGVFLLLFAILFFSNFAPVRAGFFDQANSYFSEGGKTLGDATGKLGAGALNAWQKVGDDLGEAVGVVAKDASQASDAFLGGIENFGQTVGGLGNQATKGYDAVLGKVKQGTDKVAETVINILSKKNSVKIVAPKPAVKKAVQKSAVKENAVTPASAVEVNVLPIVPIVVQKEKTKKQSVPIVSKEIIIYSNKANQESVQPLVATAVKASTFGNSVFETIKSKGDVSVGNEIVIDAATGIATLKGIKIIGTVDFTGADVKGFKQTVVNNYSSGAPMVVYNSTTKENETWQNLSGNAGGVSTHWSVGKDLTVGQNATVASGLTIGTASANGSLTVNGATTITGATTFSSALTLSSGATLSGDLTVNGNTTLGDAAGDTITVNGRLSTLNVSNGSTTSSLARNSFYIGDTAGTGYGVFYIDSSGNTSVSGTVNLSNTTLGVVSSTAANLRLAADGGNQLELWTNAVKRFYINSSGNAFASGTLQVTNTSTLYNDLLVGAASESIADAGFVFTGNDLYVDDQLGVNGNAWFDGSVRASSTLLIGTAAGTDNLFVNGNNTYIATSTAYGTAYSLVVGNGTTGALVAGGHVSPSHTGLFDLGRSGLGWNNVYASSSLYVGNGVNSSTFKGNYIATTDGTSSTVLNGSSLTLGSGTSYNSGMFNVNSNGNVSASGTFKAFGNVTSTGSVYANTITIGSLTSSGSSFVDEAGRFYIAAESGIFDVLNEAASLYATVRAAKYLGGSTAGAQLYGQIADGATAIGVKIGNNTAIGTTGSKIASFYSDVGTTERAFIGFDGSAGFVVSSSAGFAGGRFSIDSSGNTSASGSFKTYGNVTSTGHIYPATVAGADLGAMGLAFNNVYASSSLYVGNGANSSTFKGNYIATTDGTSSTVLNGSSLQLGIGTNYNQGAFGVNNQGAVSASGSVYIFGGAANNLYGLNISVAKTVPQGPDNVTTTFTSYVMNTAGSTGFAFNTVAQGGAMGSTTAGTGLDRGLLVVQNNGTNKFAISGGGNVYATAGFNANSTQYGIGDVAEYVNLTPGNIVDFGDVVVVDTNGLNQYRKSEGAYAKNVAGVISDTGAFVIGASGDGRAPLALAGLVNVKVTAENGPIAVGDYLVTASQPGYAMKYDIASGQSAGLVGMALEPLTEGDGKIKILVNKGLVAGSSGGSISLNVSQNKDGQLVQSGDLDMAGRNILKVKAITSASGAWSIDNDGLLVAKDVKADKVQAKQFIVAMDSDQKKSTVGEATIKVGGQSVEVENELVTEKVKIFVTFRANPQSFWWISKQIDGKFEISLSQNANQDVTFDYWLVGVEEAEDGNDAAVDSENSAPADVVAPVQESTPSAPEVEVSEQPAVSPVSEPEVNPEVVTDDAEKKTEETPKNEDKTEEKAGEGSADTASNS
ncbi:MAG: hypothetical protein AAB849_02600 [Patescibacteria group bacterium]